MNPHTVLGAITLPGVAESAGEARRFGRKILEGLFGADDERTDDERTDNAVLAISEAVTNSIDHSDSRFGGQITLTLLEIGGGEARIEITDDGALTTPRCLTVGDTATSGRGIALIGRVTKRSGHHTDNTGRLTYWFEL
jgi:anti-sigma regulatory factor (Ser/Thr protein kinase)